MKNELTIPSDSGLIAIEAAGLPEKLGKPGGLDEYINLIKADVAGFKGDASTGKGRKEIVAKAAKVAKSKTALSGLAKVLKDSKKESVAEVQAEITAIIAEEKRMNAELSSVAKEVRRPVTEFEEAEKERKELIEEKLSIIREFVPSAENGIPVSLHSATAAQIEKAIAVLQTLLGPGKHCSLTKDVFQESLPMAQDAHSAKTVELESALAVAKEREELAAEKERIRKEEVARKQKEHDDKIKREAEEKTKKESEKKRLTALQKRLDDLKRFDWTAPWKYAPTIKTRIDDLEAAIIDDSYEEFKESAKEIKVKLLKKLSLGHGLALESDKKDEEERTRKAEQKAKGEQAKREAADPEEKPILTSGEAEEQKEETPVEMRGRQFQYFRSKKPDQTAEAGAGLKTDLIECLRVPGVDEKTLNIQATKLLGWIQRGKIALREL